MRLCGRRYGEARRVIQRRPFSSCKKPKIISTFVAAQATDLCDWPSKNSEWVIVMWGNFPEPKNRFSREAAIRHISGTLLCALLLFFCTNARLARYENDQPRLTLSTNQAYLDSEEIRQDFTRAAPVLSFLGVIAVPLLLLVGRKVTPLTEALPASRSCKGFDPEIYLRPPPAR